MSRCALFRLFFVGLMISALLTGCSRDPNVRKQKFLESGNRYRDKGKLREAAIQYSNAIQVDSRFAEAHYQLGLALEAQNDQHEAVGEFQAALQVDPQFQEARRELAKLTSLR